MIENKTVVVNYKDVLFDMQIVESLVKKQFFNYSKEDIDSIIISIGILMDGLDVTDWDDGEVFRDKNISPEFRIVRAISDYLYDHTVHDLIWSTDDADVFNYLY